jgi:regulator of sigma E protease
MVDETQDATDLPSEPQPWEYRSKKGWQKLIIILGGIIFNLIFAALIYAGLNKFSVKEYLPAEQLSNGGVLVSENAKKLGFLDGDVILKVNGDVPMRYQDLIPPSMMLGGEYLIKRIEGNKTIEKTLTMPTDFYKKFEGGMFSPFYQNVKVAIVISGSLAEKAGFKSNDRIVIANGDTISHFPKFRSILESNKGKVIPIVIERESKMITLNTEVDQKGKIGFQPDEEIIKEKYSMKPYSGSQALKCGAKECFNFFISM